MNTARKRLLLIIFAIACMMAATMIPQIIASYKKEPITQNTVLPSPTPGIVHEIVIDAGHGGFDRGAVGTDTHVFESELNLDVALCVKKVLEKNNYSVTLTRDGDYALSTEKKEDMKIRREMMHDTDADMSVSIHMNSFTDRRKSGTMVFYTLDDVLSEKLADCILREVCGITGQTLRMSNPGDYYVIRNSTIPSVIVECGFLTNHDEEAKLCDKEYREKIAEGIAKGIMNYFEQERE